MPTLLETSYHSFETIELYRNQTALPAISKISRQHIQPPMPWNINSEITQLLQVHHTL